MKTTYLPISDIRIDGNTQPRTKIDLALVSEYGEAMKADAEHFPPVVVFQDGAATWLADGFHRWHAARAVGMANIRAEIHAGTQRDAILYSVGANAAHGQRRTDEDKRKAVLTLLNDAEWATWTHARIAELCNVSREYVSRLQGKLRDEGALTCDRSQVTTRTKHGTVTHMNVQNIGKGKTGRERVISALDDPNLRTLSNPDLADKLGVSKHVVSRLRLEIGQTDHVPTRKQQAVDPRRFAEAMHNLDGFCMGLKSMDAAAFAECEQAATWVETITECIATLRFVRTALTLEGENDGHRETA